jgi:Cu+-exporting ATPase
VLRLKIRGMHCASCVAGVESALLLVPGVTSARVNLVTREAFVESTNPPSGEEALRTAVRHSIENMGYEVEADAEGGGEVSAPVSDPEAGGKVLPIRSVWPSWVGPEDRWAATAVLLALPVFVIGMAHVRGPWVDGISLILTALILGLGWSPILRPGLMGLVRGRPDMNALVGLGTLSAFAVSVNGVITGFMEHHPSGSHGAVYFEAAAVTLTAVLAGRRIEAKCLDRATSALKSLDDRVPPTAHRLATSGAEEIVPVREIVPGDRLLIRPGDAIPTDGVVMLGRGEVDESLLTGESVPVLKQRGDTVSGGTLNGLGNFQIRVTAPAGASAAARLAEAVRSAQADRPRLQRLADRVAGIFVPVVLALATLTGIGWWIAGAEVSRSLSYAIAVLVVSCPCALGLATPVAIMAATGQAARRGILFRDADALERLARCETVVLDKTGTLTQARPAVALIRCSDGTTERPDWLGAVAAIEAQSEHPWARAIVELGRTESWPMPSPGPEEVVVIPGSGVQGIIGGANYKIGSEAWLKAEGIAIQADLDREDLTRVHVARDGIHLGWIGLHDPERPDAEAAVAQMVKLGLRPIMVTGDRKGPAEAVAQRLGLEFQSESRDKEQYVAGLQAAGQTVAMVGDGLNDAGALAQADCGLAMQSGTGLAQHSAHVLVMGNRLMAIPDAIHLARRTVRIIWQNLGWALGYNLIGIPLAAGLFMPWLGVSLSPAYAGIFMAVSSVAVTLNSLRLLAREK